MSLFDDIGLSEIVKDVLTDDMVGATCVVALAKGDYDAATDVITDVADFSETINCSLGLGYTAKEIDGTRIKVGDLKLLIAGSDWRGLPDLSPTPTKPTTAMTVVKDGVEYSIENVGVVDGGDVDVLYVLQLRR